MVVRIISGAVLLLITGSSLIIGGWYLLALCLFISLAGIYELYRVININNRLVGFTGYAGAVAWYAGLVTGHTELLILAISLFIIILMAVYVFTFPKYKTDEITYAFFAVMYVAVLISYIYQTRMLENGQYYAWLIFICSWGSDSFAYLAGVAFGKHKMAPKLSPKKSIEGAVGGVIGAAVLGALFGWFVQSRTGENQIIIAMIACAAGALVSIVGDLAASAIKRNYDIKDYSRLIPGHGGIMDRYDSVIFTAPAVYWVLYFLR